MFIAVIQATDYITAKKQLEQALKQHADGVELRLDFAIQLDFDAIADLRNEFSLPMIFTLRKKSQGGFFQQDEQQRLQDILSLCQLNPDYIDLEYDAPEYFIKKIRLSHPTIKLICSYHNFDETPANLIAIFQLLKNTYFYAYKIATYANNTIDALRMLYFVNTSDKIYKITGICMGYHGQSTRILSPVIGNAMHYASLDGSQKTAPGQLTLNDLTTIYSSQKLNTSSRIYALLGNPIEPSVGHVLHNKALQLLKKNAVYIKLNVSPFELSTAIELCRKLPFAGFSITMPLKESILPLLDEIDCSSETIQAINSITVDRNKYFGFNTDGLGTIQALLEKLDLTNQKIIILGAGGTARAIAYQALQHKATVMIINRTLIRARKLADELGCEYSGFDNIAHLNKSKYTILINTLPESAYSIELITLLQFNLSPNTLAIDIVYQPINTLFLQIAKQANCICIPGYEMYINQALLQIKHWFNPNQEQLNHIKKMMRNYFEEQLNLQRQVTI